VVEAEPFQVLSGIFVFTFHRIFARMYNKALTMNDEDEQPFVLDARDNNLRMSHLNPNTSTQKFFKVETSYESTCPAPEISGMEFQGIIGRSGPCRRRHALVNGRCQKVFG
jgi:hypothetical protein